MIKQINENGEEKIFNNLTAAAQSIKTNLREWVVQLYISYAISTNTRAFKSRWVEINKLYFIKK